MEISEKVVRQMKRKPGRSNRSKKAMGSHTAQIDRYPGHRLVFHHHPRGRV
jgi:hypothetical protein